MRFLLVLGMACVVWMPALAAAGAPATQISATPQPRLVEKIIATVNDDVITASQLADRTALAFFSSGLPPTPENRARVVPQVLRTLIDETLQRQEAKAVGVIVERAEIDQALARLAQSNNVPPEQLKDFMFSRGVNIKTLENQVEASLLWTRVIQRKLRPLVEIGEEELNQRAALLAANAGKPEFLLAEIFLRVDAGTDDAQVQNFANDLVRQVKSGANFAALAQQFSQAAGALQGGDLGWVQAGQLAPELDAALASMQRGALSDPIRSAAGYHILLVRDQRLVAGVAAAPATVQLAQVIVPSSVASDAADLQARAEKLQQAIAGCATLETAVQTLEPQARVKLDAPKPMSELPEWLAQMIMPLAVGQSTAPLETPAGAGLIVLCDKQDGTAPQINRDQIAAQLGSERLELQARRLLRDLRRVAAVDVRL